MDFFEYLYYIGLSVKRRVAVMDRKKLPCRVVSIGNITVGGTGKTPATIAVAEEAMKRRFRPIILTRGYKGATRGPCFVSKGDGPLLSASQAGDEPFLMAERLPGVEIVKGPDRYASGMFALQALGMGKEAEGAGGRAGGIQGHATGIEAKALSRVLFILDDGFQHWRLYRNRDVVLIDAGNPFGNRKLLPSGRLREPLTELKRADVIAVTKSPREDIGLIREIRKYNENAPVFFSDHRAVSVSLRSGEKKPLAWMHGMNVFCFCGLADPGSFRSTVAGTGARVAGMRVYPDHHPYTQQDIADIVKDCRVSGAEWVVTTGKDMAKIRNLDLPENILIIEIAFAADQPFYDSIFA